MPSRRDVLKASGVAGAAALAGGATRWGAWAPSVEAPSPGTWPQPRYGHENTGHNPHATPPTDSAALARHRETAREVDALAVTGERVFAGTEHAVHAFERGIGGDHTAETASARDVAVAGDTAVAIGDGAVTAVDASGRGVRWRRSLGTFVYSVLVDERTAYVGTNGELVALALDSGEKRWSLSTNRRTFAGFEDDQLLVGGTGLSGYAPRSALEGVLADGPTRAWHCKELFGTTRPVPVGDLTLVGSGGCSPRTTCSVSAVAPDHTVEWERALGNSANHVATDGERAYVVSVRYGDTETIRGTTVNVPDGATLYALDAATGEQLWTFHRPGSFCAPVVANDAVYVGNYGDWEGAGDVHALDPASGDVLWSYSDTEGVNALAAVDEFLYAATTDGVLALA